MLRNMRKLYAMLCLLVTLAVRTEACDTVTNVVVNNITNSGAIISWNAATGASYYNVWYRALPSGTWVSGTSSGTSKIIVGLQSLTSYEVAVETYCGNVPSALTTAVSFTTLNNGVGSNPLCDSVSNLTVSNITATGALVTWSPVSGASWYNIYRRTLPAGAWVHATSTSTSKVLANLIPNTPYEVIVRSACSGDTSLNVLATPFTTDTLSGTTSTGCDSVSNLTVSNITTISAKLTWNAVAGGTWYNIYRRVLPGGSWILSTTSDTTKIISGLTPGTSYAVKVVTACNNMSSANVNVTPFTTDTVVINPPTPCDSVSGVAISNISNTNATLSWVGNAGAAYYLVYLRELPSGTWMVSTSTATTKNLSGLTQNTSYEVKVLSFCNPNSSSNDYAYSFTTTNIIVNPTPCDSVPNVTVTNITDFDAVVNWTAVSGASWYNVAYRKTPSGTWNYITATGTSKTIVGLLPATAYEVIVRTYCSNDSSVNVSTKAFTTTNTCSPPTNIWIEHDTAYAGVVTIHWSPSNIVDYSIVQIRELGATNWITGTSNSANKTYSGLNEATTYEYRIANVCNGIQGTYSGINAFIINSLPLSIQTANQAVIQIYPNPAEDMLFVRNIQSTPLDLTMTVMDMGGRVVLKNKVNGKTNALDIHTLQQGMYTIQVVGNDGFVYRTKFVKK